MFISEKVPIQSAGQSSVTIGFTSKGKEGSWTFFSSFTLAILFVCQATVFCFALFRLVQTIGHQKRIDSRGSSSSSIKGTGWITVAMKLGAIEALVGFAGGSFGVAITRRVMRLISRAFLVVGMVKGYVIVSINQKATWLKLYSVDVVEDPQAISSEKYGDEKSRRPFRKSDLRELISNPRYSTFRQLPTDAIAYHPPPQAPLYVTRRKQNGPGLPTEPRPGVRDEERVTVLFSKGKPVLHLRLSDLDLPSPVVFADEIKTRSNLDWVVIDRANPTALGSATTPINKSAIVAPGADDVLEPPNSGFLASRIQSFDGRPRESINSIPSLKSDEQHPAEIIVGPRTIGKPARAQVYQTLRAIATAAPGPRSALASTSPVTFSPESKRYSPVILKNPRRGTTGTDGFSKSDSQAFTIRSASSSIKAVRELAPQFPGPPPSTWKGETDKGAETVRKQDSLATITQLAYAAKEDDDDSTATHPILFVPKNDSDDDRPVSFNQISRAPSPSPLKPTGLFPVRPIDPFDDDESSKSPGGLESVPSPINVRPKPDGESLLSTTFSNHSSDTISGVQDEDNDYKGGKISAAIVTGNSGVFNTIPAIRTPAPLSPRTRGLIALGSGEPDPAQASSPRTSNFRRIAQWVDSTEKTMTPNRATIAIPSPIAPGGASSISAQNLHERGLSIDNLTIRWVKSEAEQRKLKLATTPTTPTGYKDVKVRNIGRAPSRSTPAVQTGHVVRGSLHLEQIYHPPPIETLPTSLKGKESPTAMAKRGQVLSKIIIPPLERGSTVAIQGDADERSPAKAGVLGNEEVLAWADGVR